MRDFQPALYASAHSGVGPQPPRKLGGGSVQLLEAEDLNRLPDQLGALDRPDRIELLARLAFFRDGFRHCYGLKVDGSVAYLQWIVYAGENDIIRKNHRDRWLPLRSNEVMIENAFTFPAYRGSGFLSFVSWHLLKMAKDQGYSRAVTYVRTDKLAALNSFVDLGFRIYKSVPEYKFLGNVWRVW